MAKLPDIQYLSPTPSLGRQDISLPGRIARSQIALYGGIANVVIDVSESLIKQDMAEGVAGAQAELTQLQTTLMRDRVTDVDSFDLTAGVDYKAADVDGNPIQSISSHTVMESVWSDGAKKILGKYTEAMTPGMRRQVQEKLSGSIGKMGGMVTAQAYKWRLDEINAKAEQQVTTLVNSATFEIKDEVKMQASSIINDQVRSGFMDATEGVKKNADARSKVDYHVMLQEIQRGGRGAIDQMEEMLARPPAETGLEITLPQRKSLYARIDARNKRLEINREKTEKLERERYALNTMIDIHKDGAIEWPAMRKAARDMEPATARLLVTLNQAKMKEEAEEDEEGDTTIYNGIETDILGAGMMPLGEDVSPQVMKDTLVNKIYDALTDHQEGRPGITADQANVLYGRIDDAMKQKMRPIGYNDAKEQLAGYITKGSVANLGTKNNGAQALKFYEALRDLNLAIRTGATRDPLAWVEANKHNYLAGTTLANMSKADIAIAKGFTVLPEAGDISRPEDAPPFNASAAMEKARLAYDAGDINDKTYQMVLDYWRDQRASHMDMLTRRAKARGE